MPLETHSPLKGNHINKVGREPLLQLQAVARVECSCRPLVIISSLKNNGYVSRLLYVCLAYRAQRKKNLQFSVLFLPDVTTEFQFLLNGP